MTGTIRAAGCFEWVVLACLLSFFFIPGILWWIYVIHPDSFYVALCKNHGYPELSLYQGTNESRAKEIAETLRDVADLPYNSGLKE